MKIDDLISKATHTSGRTLLAVSCIVLLGSIFSHDLADFPILATAKNMPDGMVEFAALALIIYLLIAHAINWHTDAASYSQNKVRADFEKIKKQDNREKLPTTTEAKGYTNMHSIKLDKAKKTSKFSEKLVIDVLHLYFPIVLGMLALLQLLVRIL